MKLESTYRKKINDGKEGEKRGNEKCKLEFATWNLRSARNGYYEVLNEYLIVSVIFFLLTCVLCIKVCMFSSYGFISPSFSTPLTLRYYFIFYRCTFLTKQRRCEILQGSTKSFIRFVHMKVGLCRVADQFNIASCPFTYIDVRPVSIDIYVLGCTIMGTMTRVPRM